MEKSPSERETLLKKLKEIGDLSIKYCSHPDDDIKENAIAINRLAQDSYRLTRQEKG
jgi:hypothetical protein|tara:strand:- start:2901 stop:3071 length:171 start_codon:yes stop_codon:yes gene_type:complete